MEHPTAERSGPLPSGRRLRLLRRRDGIPSPPGVPPLSGPALGAIPERGPPETHLFGLELGNNSMWT
jgi:hypothetical protein